MISDSNSVIRWYPIVRKPRYFIILPATDLHPAYQCPRINTNHATATSIGCAFEDSSHFPVMSPRTEIDPTRLPIVLNRIGNVTGLEITMAFRAPHQKDSLSAWVVGTLLTLGSSRDDRPIKPSMRISNVKQYYFAANEMPPTSLS